MQENDLCKTCPCNPLESVGTLQKLCKELKGVGGSCCGRAMLMMSLHDRQAAPPFSVERILQKEIEFFNQLSVDFWFVCKYLNFYL